MTQTYEIELATPFFNSGPWQFQNVLSILHHAKHTLHSPHLILLLLLFSFAFAFNFAFSFLYFFLPFPSPSLPLFSVPPLLLLPLLLPLPLPLPPQTNRLWKGKITQKKLSRNSHVEIIFCTLSFHFFSVHTSAMTSKIKESQGTNSF